MPTDEAILAKLRAGMPGSGSKSPGCWFTPSECRRLAQLIGEPAPLQMPEPVATLTVTKGPAISIQFGGTFRLEAGQVLDIYRRGELHT